jgi:hypothetical protein
MQAAAGLENTARSVLTVIKSLQLLAALIKLIFSSTPHQHSRLVFAGSTGLTNG